MRSKLALSSSGMPRKELYTYSVIQSTAERLKPTILTILPRAGGFSSMRNIFIGQICHLLNGKLSARFGLGRSKKITVQKVRPFVKVSARFRDNLNLGTTLANMMLASLLVASCSVGRAQTVPEPLVAPTSEPAPAAALPGVLTAYNGQQAATKPAAVALPQTQLPASQYVGQILPEYQVTVVAEVGGLALQLNPEVGDFVKAGDILLVVEHSELEAQRAQALAALEAAQAQFEILKVEPGQVDIEDARAAVAAADAAYKRALAGPTPEELRLAETQLNTAEAALQRAQDAYDQVAWNPLVAALPESLQLEQATLLFEEAQAQHDKLVQGSTPDVIAGAYAQLASARAQLQHLEEGAKPAQLQAAEARVRQAETALYLSQLQLEKATVRAPVDGIVSQVSTTEGAMIVPGSPLAHLLSPELKITIAVEELRLPNLRIGQGAIIHVGAYPDRTFDGEVAVIAPEVDPATATVSVTIRPSDDATELAPGMLVTVDLLQ